MLAPLPNYMRSEPKIPQQKLFYKNGKLHSAASNSRAPVISYISSELGSKFEISSANKDVGLKRGQHDTP